MRTGKIEINGKEYITCMSIRVLTWLEDYGDGDSNQNLSRLIKEGRLTDMFELLVQLIDAGDRYAKLNDIENPGVLTYDELVDTMGIDDVSKITEMAQSITDTIRAGSEGHVKAKPVKPAKGKNAKATPEAVD